MSKTTTPQPLLVRVREALGLAAVDDLFERISVELLERTAAVVDQRALINAAVADVLSTGQIPADIGSDIAQARQDAVRNTAALDVLRSCQERMPQVFREVAARNADRALSVVRDEVTEVVTLARPAFAALGPVRTAEDAIEHDLADQWGTVRRLAARYVEARLGQATIASAALDNTPHGATIGDAVTVRGSLLVTYWGTVREPWRHDPAVVREFDRQLGRLRTGDLGERADYFGRPQGDGQHRPPWQVDSTDPLPAFRWAVVTEGAESFVPDLAELVEHEREGREIAAANGYTRHANLPREPWEPRTPAPAGPSMFDTVIEMG